MSGNDIEVNPWGFRIPTGGELRSIRHFLDMTQFEVSEKVDINYKTLRSWENENTVPNADSLRELLDFYREEYRRVK